MTTLVFILLLGGALYSALARAETSDNPFADGSLELALWVVMALGAALIWFTPHGGGQ